MAVLKAVWAFVSARVRGGKASTNNQIVFDDRDHKLGEMTEEMVRDKAEQFVLALTAGKLFC